MWEQQQEIKSALTGKYPGNACYHSFQSPLSSRVIPKMLKIKKQKTIILPVVLYGRETWSLTLKEDQRLTVYEKRVLRRIFGPKREEVAEGWRRLYNEELHILYASLNIKGDQVKDEMGGACKTHGRDGKCMQYFG
jgi:hypothetical protein